jgi:hypothetical protein
MVLLHGVHYANELCTADCGDVLVYRPVARAHKAAQDRCPGSGQKPGEDVELASWLPVSPGLTHKAGGPATRLGWTRRRSLTCSSPSGWRSGACEPPPAGRRKVKRIIDQAA